MANIVVTMTKFDKVFEEEKLVSKAASDETVADTAQIFEIDPEEGADKVLVKIDNADAGAMAVKVLGNDGYMRSYSKELSFSAAQGETVIQISGARHLRSDRKIHVELTPAAGKALLTDHAAAVSVVKLS